MLMASASAKTLCAAMGLGRPSLSLLSAVKKCFVRFCFLQVPKEEEDYDEMNLCTNCNQPLLLWNIHIDTTLVLYKVCINRV